MLNSGELASKKSCVSRLSCVHHRSNNPNRARECGLSLFLLSNTISRRLNNKFNDLKSAKSQIVLNSIYI